MLLFQMLQHVEIIVIKNILMIIEFKPRQSPTSVVGITSDDQTNFNLVSEENMCVFLVG
jgi:hypothetical protein